MSTPGSTLTPPFCRQVAAALAASAPWWMKQKRSTAVSCSRKPLSGLARHRHHRAKPVEVRGASRLRDVGALGQEHRVFVHGLVEKGRADRLAVECPPDGAIGTGIAVDVGGDRIVVLGLHAGEADVEETEQAAVTSQPGLLVRVDLVAEDEAERRLVIPPGVQVGRVGRGRMPTAQGLRSRTGCWAGAWCALLTILDARVLCIRATPELMNRKPERCGRLLRIALAPVGN